MLVLNICCNWLIGMLVSGIDGVMMFVLLMSVLRCLNVAVMVLNIVMMFVLFVILFVMMYVWLFVLCMVCVVSLVVVVLCV